MREKILLVLLFGLLSAGCTNPRFVLIYEDGETAHKKLKIESMTQVQAETDPVEVTTEITEGGS